MNNLIKDTFKYFSIIFLETKANKSIHPFEYINSFYHLSPMGLRLQDVFFRAKIYLNLKEFEEKAIYLTSHYNHKDFIEIVKSISLYTGEVRVNNEFSYLVADKK